MTDFEFDERTQRYRYTSGDRKGQFVSHARARALINKAISDKKNDADRITDKLLNDEITLAEWERRIASLLKITTIQVYKAGKPKLTLSDYGRIGGFLRNQFAFLRRFSGEIADGRFSVAYIKNRTRYYFLKTRQAFEEAKRHSHNSAGFIWEIRRLAIAEHCQSCIIYANLGWQPINTLPAITTRCECRANDKCYFEFSRSRQRPSFSLKHSWYGWINAEAKNFDSLKRSIRS